MQSYTFNTREELISAVRDHYKQQGVVTTIKRSDSKKGKVIFGCDRSGKYRNRVSLTEDTRQRQTSTRLTECPFEVKGKRQLVDGQESWSVFVVSEEHNHEHGVNLIGHPYVRRLSSEEKTTIHSMSLSGIRPSQMLSYLKEEHGNCNAIRSTIYNELTSIRLEVLDGRTAVDTLLHVLRNGPFEFQVDFRNGCIANIFFSHKKSIELCRRFSTVFLLDCT